MGLERTLHHAKRPIAIVTRNDSLVDPWSGVHLATGVLFGWLLTPWLAILLLVLWEPVEVLVISPLLAKRGIVFGQETLRNSLSDIVFDIAGWALGYFGLHLTMGTPI